jgi:hypothetical protein
MRDAGEINLDILVAANGVAIETSKSWTPPCMGKLPVGRAIPSTPRLFVATMV